MSFPLGKPILVMLVMAIASGAAVALRPDPPRSNLTMWVFADTHYAAYRQELPALQLASGTSIDLQLVQVQPMSRRLQAAFADELSGTGVPDVVEIEIGQIGRFFRPPTAEIGFEPMRPWLEKSGWYSQIVPSRYAPWTRRGVIFGIPHDVHPVGIAYRHDLFAEAGIDLPAAATWPQFQDACLRFQHYSRDHGYATRHAIELHAARSDYLALMLQQRGISLVDDFDRVHMTDPKVAETLAFYARCVAGPLNVAGDSGDGDGPMQRDLRDGDLCAYFAADWRLAKLQQLGGDALHSKLRFMPLPRFDPTAIPPEAPTATWGGTMIGILRCSPRKDQACKLIQRLYFDRPSVEARRQVTSILPIQTFWTGPSYQQPNDYFGGQHIDATLVQLAHQIPPTYVTPATNLANLYLTQVLDKATRYVREHDDAGLEAACRQWLTDAAADLTLRMKQWDFDR